MTTNPKIAKLFEYPCGCVARIIRGKFDRFNFCNSHFKEMNEMEMDVE